MAVDVMEGSYYLLLSYNLLIYITAKTTNTRTTQRTFLEYTRFCKKMVYHLPNDSFPQTYPDFVYSASEATPQARPHSHSHSHQQRDRLALDLLDPNNFHTTNTLDQNNIHAHGTIGLNKELTDYSWENLRGPNRSSLSVSHTPVKTNFLVPNLPVPIPTAYNSANPYDQMNIYGSSSNAVLSNYISFQQDDNWRKQLDAQAYGNFPNPQEMAHGINFPIDATAFSGLDIRETGYLKGFSSGATNFNGENVHYTAQPHQSSTNRYGLDLPSIYNPQNLARSTTGHNCVESLGILKPSRVSVPRCPASNMTKHNGPRSSSISTPVHTAPSLSMQKTAGLESYVPAQQRLAPSMSNHNQFQSYTSTTHGLYLRTNPNHLEPSGIPNHSQSSITSRHALNMTDSDNLGPSDNSIPPYLTPKVDELNKFDPSVISPQRRVDPKVCNTGSVDPLNTSALCNPIGVEGLESSDISISYPLVPDIAHPNGPESSNISIKDDDVFTQFTTLNDNPQTLSENASNAPNVNHSHVSDAVESHTRHCCTGHQIRDAGSEEVPKPRRKYQRRNKSNVSPEIMEPRERKKRVRKTDPNSGRRYPSTRKRRTDPKQRYFCAIPTCKESREQGSKGFATSEDFKRHAATHGPRQYVCTLPHINGGAQYFGRGDGLQK